MKVKKYIAPTMPEVMNQVRKELGRDAVILNSKEVQHGGFMGFFKKKSIEVVAALDPEPLMETAEQPRARKDKSFIHKKHNPIKNNDTEVLSEIKHLKKIIGQISVQKADYLPNYNVVFQHLLDQEVEWDLASEIMDSVVEKHREEGVAPSRDIVIGDVRSEIENRLAGLSTEGINDGKKIIHFIGPTGVGKTTTLAKIAANCMLTDHKRVAFITMDTYRIAAIEQLRTYARILDIPIKVAYTMEDYNAAVKEFTAYDLILVDTAGRNFRDEKYVNELKESMHLNLDIEIFLVLSLTAKPNDLSEIYDQFHQMPIKGIIFSKIDETRQYGSMLNIAFRKQIGISYIANGQDVPDDLLPVTPDAISNYILGMIDDE